MNFDKLVDYFKLDKQEFYFQFNSHPNYPSALAFSDTLNFMGIKNDAYELEKEYWDELPDEFMALVNNSFSLVKKDGKDFITYSDQVKTISKEELYKNSNDFVLLFEKTEQLKTKSLFNFKPAIFAVFGIIILYSFLQFSWFETVFNVLSLIGVYISVELFNQKFGNESVVVNNICGGGSSSSNTQSSCSKIFTSDTTNILGLKLSDLSLIYFLGISIIGLLFPAAQFVLKAISLLSIGVILYSAYVQIFVEKSICRVCLLIILVLLSQIVLSLLFFTWNFSLHILFISVILFVALFLTLVFINNLTTQKEELKKSNAKNLRFKRNYDLFRKALLDKEQLYFSNKEVFFLGNKEAKLHISMISNPYCGFCKDAHKILDDLLMKYPNDISAQIRFGYHTERNDEKHKGLISDFIKIYKNKSQQYFLKTIHDWFEKRDEKQIHENVGNNYDDVDLTEISQMTQQNIEFGLAFTPIFIINGYQFPDQYDREDIYYFIDELLEDEDLT